MTLNILIGDDQFGADTPTGQRIREDLELDYRGLFRDRAVLTYTADPDHFIELASTRKYDILLIDLNWCPEDASRDYKTGFRVLKAVQDYAPKRILWTAEEAKDRERGFDYGATDCVNKRPMPAVMEKALYG
jgi:DNA-binding response OmpR family regulator